MITLYTFGPNFGLPDPSPFVTKADVLMKMSGMEYRTDTSGFNKAPKGKLPYINDDGRIIADSTFIREHLETRHGIDFNRGLPPAERAIGWALERMCEEHLYWCIVEARWMVKDNFRKGPKRFFDPVPAMVRPLIIAKFRRDLNRSLCGQGLGRHSRAEIEKLAACDLAAISDYLGDKAFLFGAEPHAADASVFASVLSALCPHFDTPIRTAAEGHANLIAYRDRGIERWYPELAR